jgi:uncharacterized repeat protein (TIGR02543 family)
MKLIGRVLALISVLLCGCLLLRFSLSLPEPSPSAKARAAGQAHSVPKAVSRSIAGMYGKLPLSFEVNQGQSSSRVKFIARGPGYALFLTGDEAVLSLRPKNAGNLLSLFLSDRGPAPATAPTANATTLRMKLHEPNPGAKIVGMDELPGKTNYFIGNDPRKWRTNIPTYGKVKFQGVYPGVDLLYYGDQRQLEYDFVVAPGANPQQIALDIQGARELQINAAGDLVAQTEVGEVLLRKPVAYQWASRKQPSPPNGSEGKHFLDARYRLRGKNRIVFEASAYDPSKPLIIDPVLTYSTFLGGGAEDIASNIDLDPNGNAYVTGGTFSADFPVTSGVPQPAFGGAAVKCGGGTVHWVCGDAYVTKINPTGTALVYSTFLGGNDADVGTHIAVDSAGDAFVSGITRSANFPTTLGVFQPQFGGGNCGGGGGGGGHPCNDGFIAKLNPSGSALVYSSFLGGSLDDGAFGVAIDGSGDAFITGQTDSSNFPTTPGSFRPKQILACAVGVSPPCLDAFVVKVDPKGTSLIYGTYLGGTGDDSGIGITIDSAGDAFVAGSTASTDFPGTTGFFQPNFGGGTTSVCPSSFLCGDAFVAELNPQGSALVYATYLGGTGDDAATSIVLDGGGNAYVAGITASSNFPTTAGAAQTTFGGGSTTACAGRLFSCGDAFAAKINPTGTALVYSTFIGGSGDDGAFWQSIIDFAGDFYLVGTTNSPNFPTAAPIQAAFGGGSPNCNPMNDPCGDGFITEINPSGSKFIFSTYLGGTSDDGVTGIMVDDKTGIYVTGFTASPNFPTTTGAFQTKCGTDGNCNALSDSFVTKLAETRFQGTFALGEVFAATGGGAVEIFQPDGTFLGTLDTGTLASAGMAFDKSGNLYVTTFGAPSVVKFDIHGNLLGNFGSGYTNFAESILFDLAGNAFVGAATASFGNSPPTVPIFEFTANGNPVTTLQVASDQRGSDWIELLGDQKTMLYTSEGHLVKSFNVSTNTQNPDFAANLPGASAYAFRQVPTDGSLLVADTNHVLRLNPSGAVTQTYTPTALPQVLFAVNLDPDGVSFWTADLGNGNVTRFNIATGAQISAFNVPSSVVAGLAIFGEKAPGTNNLTVTKAGTGSGTVISTPPGILCGLVCTAPFATGSTVNLRATPNEGSVFTGWSGACTGAGTCNVTTNGDQSVTATFGPANFILTVNETGNGSGSVTSNPPGITCPDVCSSSFPTGSQVTLTATPAQGFTFTGWSGPCSGTGTCSVTMNSNQTVTANFTNQPVTLTAFPGSPTTATVHPGDSAIFPLVLSSSGFTGTVTLSCASQQPTITCSVVPSTVQLSSSAPTEVAIGVNTFCAWLPPLAPPSGWPGNNLPVLWTTVALGMALLGFAAAHPKRRLWFGTPLAVMALVALLAAGCASVKHGPAGRTPPGTYILTITATPSSGAPSSINVTLTVI